MYLTGPLKATSAHGASPFGLSVVTHAAVGPFDLGNVRVLSTLNVDPTTAAVSITSDPFPPFVKGIPSQLKQVNVEPSNGRKPGVPVQPDQLHPDDDHRDAERRPGRKRRGVHAVQSSRLREPAAFKPTFDGAAGRGEQS